MGVPRSEGHTAQYYLLVSVHPHQPLPGIVHWLLIVMSCEVFCINACKCIDTNVHGLQDGELSLKGLLHGYEWGLRFGGLELRFG